MFLNNYPDQSLASKFLLDVLAPLKGVSSASPLVFPTINHKKILCKTRTDHTCLSKAYFIVDYSNDQKLFLGLLYST